MADQDVSIPFQDGPFIQAACMCETVIQDKTDVFSLIRIIDTITRTVTAPDPPDDMPPFEFSTKLVLMFKSGRATGRYDLKIVPQLPSGELQDPTILPVHFGDEEMGGHNIVTELRYTFTQEGVYWFKILLSNTLLTKIPLRIRYNPITIGPVQS